MATEMSLEKDLAEVRHAHRVLAARHEALMMSCRLIFPFISIPLSLRQRLMTATYDALSENMEKRKFDAEFQRYAREAIDELFGTVLIDPDLKN